MSQLYCIVHSDNKEEFIGMESILYKNYWEAVMAFKELTIMNSIEFISVD